MKKLLIAVFFAVTSLLSACGKGEAPTSAVHSTPAPSNKLTIIGSTTLFPIAAKAVEVLHQRKPELQITLQPGGSLAGINALTDGLADVAMSSRELKSDEKAKLKAKRIAIRETIVGWDGITPIVHPTNPVTNLTIAQLKDIYTGKVTDWKQVGGKPGVIVIVARDFTSGTHEAWDDLVLNKEPVAASAQEQATSSAIVEVIARSPNAIGYDGIGYVEGNKLVKTVSVDGQTASASSILNKSYKIARPLYLFTRDSSTTAVEEFLTFITSSEGQTLVKETHFIPLPK
jgi:phosphate transport system substrate-binding protein